MKNNSISIDEIFAKDLKDPDFRAGVEKESSKLTNAVKSMNDKEKLGFNQAAPKPFNYNEDD
ncbi:XRE family transcriptional regulator [Fructilactobacillus frigidiflavus]|uniref:XRE family transcriptional regulator n=1 Tax=Fructilactobacillus frigidiflavus TaxID=3242688 RepID=UPI0037567420